ncbi:TPA: HI1506-related protein [Yersinia enterocolitica]
MPIQITAKRDGFRRCGMAHSDKTQTYADGHFSPSVLAELMAEPMLVVSHVPDAQQGNAEQSKELVQALAHIETLNGQLTEKDLFISEFRKNHEGPLTDMSALAATNVSLNAQVGELTAQIASLTPAPDAASKEPADTKTTKTTK